VLQLLHIFGCERRSYNYEKQNIIGTVILLFASPCAGMFKLK